MKAIVPFGSAQGTGEFEMLPLAMFPSTPLRERNSSVADLISPVAERSRSHHHRHLFLFLFLSQRSPHYS